VEGMIPGGALRLFGRWGGSGPAVLLLHGHPRTSATWHRVAPQLVKSGFTVVCLDLPGYGRSDKPMPTDDHVPHSKKVGAGQLLAAMTSLGHERFSLVGHDRGSLYAFRLALDHPSRVTRVALLDCLPVSEHLDRIDVRFATAWWHWFFFAQPEIPERVINADPDSWYHGDVNLMGQENYEEWRAALRDPAVVRAMLEDYRAGLTVDYRDESADRSRMRGWRPCCGSPVALWGAYEALRLNVPRVSRRNASRWPVLEFWPGTCQESAVDGKRVSGDPGSVGGSKGGDRGSDVLRFPDPSERVEMAEAIGSALLSLPVSSPDRGWSDSVHSDAVGRQTGRKVDR
jgi:haloacetate dehalogenase